ncbi:Protein of unknown function DUF885 [Trinorchestia longiramus]|nr:Protein of unknown function DUF885 [Trinorchestia longiramus]
MSSRPSLSMEELNETTHLVNNDPENGTRSVCMFYALVAIIVMTTLAVYFVFGAVHDASSVHGGKGTKLSDDVQQLCDDFWDWRLQDMPEFATFVGFHEYNDRLDDLSMEAFDNRLNKSFEFLGRVDDIEPALTEHEDIVNIRVLRDELETFIDGYPYKNFYMPLNNKEGIQVDLVARTLSWMPRTTVENYNTMVTRLQGVPTQVEQIIQLLTAGVEAGLTMHNFSMNQVPSQIEKFVVSSPEESPIYVQYFSTDFPSNFTTEEITSIQEAAKTTISDLVTPAFERLQAYIVNEYKTRPDIAVSSLPNGPALYSQLIKFHAGLNKSAEEIQQIGYQEVDRIEALMQEIVYELGYNMTTLEFSDMILEDDNNFYSSEEDLMNGFRYIVYNVTTPAIPLIFKNIPSAEILVQADPSGTGAYYLAGSYDGSRPGVFYVGTQDIKSNPKFEMLTLSLHEGNPGHHLQGSYALESPNLPYFRSAMEDRNYGYSPSRFPIRAFYLEGWGLYAETTGFDMNLYGDLLERYGHYSDEIFRACRLVVDTGIHALNWSRDEAVDYILQHSAMTRLDTENEVDRYITWPGQALAYKSGQLQISSFRSSAEEQLGDQFDIKDFHDVILDSVGPMSLVEEEVNEWILSVLA